MPYWLELLTGALARGPLVPLREGGLVIGRDETCDVVLPETKVSRRHAVVAAGAGGRVQLRDLDSAQGTFLGTARLAPQVPILLAEGESFSVGTTRLVLRGAPATSAGPSPAESPPAGPPQGGPSQGGTSPSGPAPERTAVSAPEWQAFSLLLADLGSLAEPRDVLDRLLHGAVGVLGAGRGVVALCGEGAKGLTPVSSHRLEPADASTISSTVCAEAVRQGALLVIDDSLRDPMCAQAPSLHAGSAPRAIMCCPLLARGTAFGVLYVDRPAPCLRWQPAEQGFLRAVTTVTAEFMASLDVRRRLVSSEERFRNFSLMGTPAPVVVHGGGPAARKLASDVAACSRQDVTVLITGETGTGKELAARAIHLASARSRGPFVPVSCAALPADTVAAELFGAEKGAYTGAVERRLGRFELASGGTLFLDEVGDLPPQVQVLLLRVLEERTVFRMGSSTGIPLDVRLICATNAPMEDLVRAGRFRPDLYYRLNVFRLSLAPLRERPEDVVPLAEHFVEQFARSAGVSRKLSPEARARAAAYPWPGNIRELRNVMECAVIVARGEVIGPDELRLPLGGSGDGVGSAAGAASGAFADGPCRYDAARSAFDRAFLERSLRRQNGSLRAVARETGIARATLYRWVQALGLSADHRGGDDEDEA